jgi:hypothetical protein
MLLICWIVVDYLIDLFNRNSRDYREVSRKLSEMKSADKINQQEERIRAQTSVATVNQSFIIIKIILLSFVSRHQLSISMKLVVLTIRIRKVLPTKLFPIVSFLLYLDILVLVQFLNQLI